MKKSIFYAIIWCLFAFLLIDIVVAKIVIVSLSAAHVPEYSQAATLWDRFAGSPLAFFLTGIVFGTLAAGRNTLKETLQPAAIFGGGLAIIVPIVTRQLILLIQAQLRRLQPDSQIVSIGDPQILLTVAASILWACWFVAGAAVGHGLRTRRSLPKTA